MNTMPQRMHLTQPEFRRVDCHLERSQTRDEVAEAIGAA